MPGTEPSSLARPASAATPVAVPIVSKKSVSMIAKIDRIAVERGRASSKTLVRSNVADRRERSACSDEVGRDLRHARRRAR